MNFFKRNEKPLMKLTKKFVTFLVMAYIFLWGFNPNYMLHPDTLFAKILLGIAIIIVGVVIIGIFGWIISLIVKEISEPIKEIIKNEKSIR